MRPEFKLAFVLCVAACTTKKDARDSSRDVTVAASSTVSSVPTCGDRVIRGDGIGELKLGMPADSVKAKCHVAFDTVRPGPEGMTQRVMMVAFPPDAVEAEVVNDSVWRIDVTAPGFQTPDSVRVGSAITVLLRRGDAQGLVGEGNFVVIYARQCGLSFFLSGGVPAGRMRDWNRQELAKLPVTTTVEKILVYKCPPPPPGPPPLN